MYRRQLILYLITAVSCLTLLNNVCMALPQSLKIGAGFEVNQDDLTASTSHREAKLFSKDAFEPGIYVFKAEYKTDGFEPLGLFAVDIKTPDYKFSLSSYEWHNPAGGWSEMVLYFQVTDPTVIMIRFGHWKKATNGATLSIRHISIEPFDLAKASENNWLSDGAFEKGHLGFMPPEWYWQHKTGVIEQTALVTNGTYRSGKHVLQLTGAGQKTHRLQTHTFPLPHNGELEFSVWAKSDDGAKIGLHIIRDDWGKRAEKSHHPSETWKKYSVKWPVFKAKRKWFFLRLDKDNTTSTVQLADMKLIWHPATKTSQKVKKSDAVDPYAVAKSLGWQGTPGPNLLYNPDMEMGGTGFFYDYSWPKSYAKYFKTSQSKPIVFLENEGVDGGTCALLRKTTLRAYCFPVTVGKTYTISADLKAAKDAKNPQCSVLALDPEWHVTLWTKAQNIPSDQWKRYSWTIKWTQDNIQNRGYVNFGGSDVLLDRIQVVEGTESAYQAPPVMLGLTYDRWPYFMKGRDQAKAKIKIVPGVKRAGKTAVYVVAKDAWGNVVWQRRFEAPLDRNTIMPIDLPVNLLGTFHVDLTADINGKNAGLGLSRYAIIDAPVRKKRKAGEYGLAGICQESFNFPTWLCEDHATIQSDMGITLNRLFASIPPDLPMPIPAEFKEELLAKSRPFSKAGIDLMPCMGALPRSHKRTSSDLDMPTPERLDLYAQHVHAYVDALKSEIKNYEIFNEPNLWRVHDGPDRGKSAMYPKKYFEFQKVAYRTIKRIDPNLTVACNAMNNVRWDWLNEWMELGAGNYMDVFTYHPYGQTNFFSTGVKLQKVMSDFGFNGPMVNTEKYYGANMFHDRSGYEETRRGYYLPHSGELVTAGRSIQHFVSQAAVGMPVCFFNPTETISRRGPAGELFVYDFFTAYSTAARLMANAGRGSEIELGATLNAIVFMDAQGGPLTAIWSPKLDVDAKMMINGDFHVMDIMGNRYSSKQMQSGVRIAPDPVYIRFKSGTTKQDIATLLTHAKVLGLGDPFKVDVAITGSKQISVYVDSLGNNTLDGKVRLFNLPKGWELTKPEVRFTNLLPGSRIKIDYSFDAIQIDNLKIYNISALVEHGESFVRSDVQLRPMFAKQQQSIHADGDLNDWQNISWIDLGDDHISRSFSRKLKRKGDQDLSAKIAMGWNQNAFMLAIVVIDDKHQSAQSAGTGWEGDSLQIYFDPQNDATVNKHNTADDITYVISRVGNQNYAWIQKGAQGNYKGKANRTDGLNDGDVELAIIRKNNQTIYEIVFPQASCIPGAVFKADGNLGFSLLINDNDGKGRKTGLTLAPKNGEPYNRPYAFLDLIFQ